MNREYSTPKCMVYSLSMTNWLCNHGFKILKVEDSNRDRKIKVFFFENTPELRAMMKKFREM